MFQAVPPPIIRSTKLYIPASGIVKPILLPAAIVDEMEQSSISSINRLKHVEQFIEINSGGDGTLFHLIHDSSRQQYWLDNT